MVVCQTALSVVCLAAAGLVLESFWNVLRVEPGFRADHVLTVDVSLSPARFKTLQLAAFIREVEPRLAAIPGVMSVAFVNRPPLTGTSLNSLVVREGTEEAAITFDQRPLGDIRAVDAEYFRTFGIPLLQGTLFNEAATRPVAVISAAMANRAWPGENPVGKRFRLTAQPGTLVEVVGIVGNVRNMGLEADVSPSVYLPFWQFSVTGATFAVRTSADASPIAASVRAVISATNHNVPIDRIRTMQTVVDDAVAVRSFQATLLTLFGVIAVVLAGVGIFGMMSHVVAQRTKELGIRLALGASAGSLQQMIVGDALRLVGAGLAIGVPLAVAGGFALRHTLFGIEPQDPSVLSGSSALFVFVALVAVFIPARRIARIDPATVLRDQ
jgi:predicted permease